MNKLLCLTVVLFLMTTVLGESGKCSFYSNNFQGKKTACGQRFHKSALTAAHRTLACGTKVRVRANGKTVIVTVNDRGPFIAGRILDLSRSAFRKLASTSAGVVSCTVTKG